MKSQHTPGPWFINDAKTAIMAHDGGTLVAYHPALPWENLEAPTVTGAELVRRMIKESHCNAQLMASAPELLVALENLLGDWERVHGPVPEDHEARAAIAKAKGGAR
jgi:hypothetical protein